MSRLSDLYNAMETLRKENINLDDVEKQVAQLEEDIVKKDILPVIIKSIAPALKDLRREVVLVVDYKPDEPITVHLSRRLNLTDIIPDAKEIVQDPEVEHKNKGENTKPRVGMAPQTHIKITFKDGTYILEKNAALTFTKFVKTVGPEKVRSLNIILSKVPLVSNTLDKKYGNRQKPLGDGWYLMTHSDTATKKKVIEKIAEALNMRVVVEVI